MCFSSINIYIQDAVKDPALKAEYLKEQEACFNMALKRAMGK